MKGNDPSCCCTWREKGRQATAGRRSLKSRGQVFNLNVSTGRHLSHLPLPSVSSLSWPLLTLRSHRIASPPDERCWWAAKTELESTSKTQARQFISVKSCVCIHSHLATPPKLQGGVLFGRFPKSRPVTWKHLGFFFPVLSLFSCRKRPHFVLPAKVTQFLWRATTTYHKSTRLTMGPQIYQPECFESGATSWHARRRGAHRCPCAETYGRCSPTLQSRKRCPAPGPQPDFTAASRETRRYKGPGSTSISRAKLLGNKSFWGFMKKEKGEGGIRKCAALTQRKSQNRGA